MSIYYLHDKSYCHYFFECPDDLTEKEDQTNRFYRNVLGGFNLGTHIEGSIPYINLYYIILHHAYYSTHPTPSTRWEMSRISSYATLSPTTPTLPILGIYQYSYISDFWKIPDVACITHHLGTACWLKVVKDFCSENF